MIREIYSFRAKRLNQEQKADIDDQSQRTLKVNDNNNRVIGVGLQGVGDGEYPISKQLLTMCSKQKDFVKKCSNAWIRDTMAGPPENVPKVPDVSTRRILCREKFCWCSVREGLHSQQVQYTTGLLKNIVRSIQKNRNQKNMQSITGEHRHPLLFVKVHGGIWGWMVVRPSFKPLSLTGWHLEFAQRDCMQTTNPFVATLCFETDVNTGKKMPRLESFEQIVARVSERDITIMYRMSSYRVGWCSEMYKLSVQPSEWITMSEAEALHHGNNDDDDDDDSNQDDDQDAISELNEATKVLGQNKRSTLDPTHKHTFHNIFCN